MADVPARRTRATPHRTIVLRCFDAVTATALGCAAGIADSVHSTALARRRALDRAADVVPERAP